MPRWLVGGVVLAFFVLMIFVVYKASAKCEARGGTLRAEYVTTVFSCSGNPPSCSSTPVYNYVCRDPDGKEILP